MTSTPIPTRLALEPAFPAAAHSCAPPVLHWAKLIQTNQNWRSSLVAAVVIVVAAVLCGVSPAWAVKSIAIGDEDRIELTEQSEFVDQRGDSIQIETAAGTDGVAGRMSVRASTPGVSPNWVVFALRNATDKQLERWVTAERYTVIGSGIVWPDLDTRRIEAVTPSVGFLPERVKSDRADIFRISLDPGQTVTYAVELSSDRFARIYLWKPVEYELKARDRQLFNGILLGITGVLGIFLTAVFAANHKAIFPSAALLTWCVLGYLCVDFGFWHKLFQLRPEDNAVYRAATESAVAASLLVFMYIFLRLTASHGFARMLLGVWMVAQIALIAVAVIDARLSATFARASFAGIAGIGAAMTGYLAMRGQDRALSLLPTWILFIVWVFAASMTLTGRLNGDIVVSSLTAGLVLITVLVGFTVTQFAFRSLEPMMGAAPSEQQLRSLAIEGSGAAVWEWNARRAEVKTGPLVEAALGLPTGELSGKVDDFCTHLHPADRERFRLMLWSVQERGGGEVKLDIRIRHADSSYRWFDLEAASVPSEDRRVLRCVGLMREVTDVKRSQERLMHDAVHDSLTGLPNRELFLDRLGVAVARAKNEPQIVPIVMLIDIDKFKSVNASFGLLVGDSLLLTLARRLQRHLEPQDSLARIGGNQFALLMMQQRDPRDVAQIAERIRRSLRSPIKLSGQEIVLTGSVGIALYDEKVVSAEDLLKDAEIAMYRAKRGGADRIEIFREEFRLDVDDRVTIESDLRVALEKRQLMVLYQPIISLATEELAGYEALVRWQHPKLGLLNPDDFVPIAEGSDLIVKLGSYVLTQAVEDASRWQKLLPRVERAVFVSVNVSSRQLFRQDLIQEIRHIAGRALVPPGCLKLEITESLVMENPERAVEVLEWLRSAGAGLSLDDFGTGYSSLSYLNRFPFDTIKIDRDLVQSSSSEGTGSVIVRSIVALAHELGKKVVAEGVESESDAGFLRSIGAEYAQGYYYGEPMSQRDVERMLKVIGKTEHRAQRSTGFLRNTLTRRRKAEVSRRKASTNGGVATPAVTTGDGSTMAAKTSAQTALRKRARSGAPGRGQKIGANGAATGAASGAAASGVMPPRAMPQPQGQPPMPPPAPMPPAMQPSASMQPMHGSMPSMDTMGLSPAPPPPPMLSTLPPELASPQHDIGLPPLIGNGAAIGLPPLPPSPLDAGVFGASAANGHGYPQQQEPQPLEPLPVQAETYPPINFGGQPPVHGLPEAPQPAASETPPTRRPSPPRRSGPAPDLSTLPPAIAASLAKLAKGGNAAPAAPAAPAERSHEDAEQG